MKNRIVSLILAIIMVLSSVAVFASCGDSCDNHVDANHDGKCDNEGCGKDVTVTHKDTDGDGVCDVCDADMPDASCDHYDDDGNGKCDECGESIDSSGCEHVDENEDGWCDLCDEEFEGSEEEVINYPWDKQKLIFQMTHNTHGDELPSACLRYLAGEDTSASEDIDNQIITRNAKAEYLTKVEVTYLYYPNTDAYGWGKNISIIENTVKLGSTSDSPDMYVNFVYDMVAVSLKGCFANLKSISRGTGNLRGLNYFEFLREDYDETKDNRGYMYEYMTSLTLSKHKMYVLASDYFLDMIRAFFCVPVSVTLLEGIGEKITGDIDGNPGFTIDDFYKQVKDGNWTYDLLMRYSQEIYMSEATNSGVCNIGDEIVGFAMASGGLPASGLLYTTSIVIIHKEWDNSTNDWKYYYPTTNQGLYDFCDATSELFQSPGVCIVSGDVHQYGASPLLAIRNRFSQNHVLFGDIMLVGSFEFEQYQLMKENGGFGIVPVPLFRTEYVNDKGETVKERYLTLVHNVGRCGAISANTLKFVECTAFLNYQSTHSTDILNEYYDYKLQYDVAGGARGTVEMLQYIRSNVRSAFDKTFEDAIGVHFEGADANKWHSIMATNKFVLDIREVYKAHYGDKAERLRDLVLYYLELPD